MFIAPDRRRCVKTQAFGPDHCEHFPTRWNREIVEPTFSVAGPSVIHQARDGRKIASACHNG